MNIHENTALLDAFVDGELTSDEMIQVQAHLDECPACQAYVDDALAIRAAFPTEDDLPLPADFTENVMRSVAKAPQSRPKKQPWGKLAAAAACLAVIVLVQHGALGGTGSTDSASAYDTAAVMDVAAAESAPAERSMDSPSADTESEETADNSAEAFTATSDGSLETQKSKDTAAYTSGSGQSGIQVDLPSAMLPRKTVPPLPSVPSTRQTSLRCTSARRTSGTCWTAASPPRRKTPEPSAIC